MPCYPDFQAYRGTTVPQYMYPMYPQQQQQPKPQMQQVPGYLAPSGSTIPGTPVTPSQVQNALVEESYIENILRLNLGKTGTFYMTYENNKDWNAKIFKGVIEAAGRDHIIISDPNTGMRWLLLMVNLDYVTFDEELNYAYPFR